MPFPIEAADFTGDGKDDFALGIRTDLHVYQSNAPGAPPTRIYDIYTGSGNEVQDLAIADYDGDGSLDIAIRMMNLYTGADTGIRIYNDLFTATPSEGYLLLQPPAGTGYQMENVDADGDGITDLMCLGDSIEFFSVRLGALTHLPSGYVHELGPAYGASGDVDNDGDQDVVVFGASGSYRVLSRTGAATFVLESAQTGGPATELADVDLDGDLDGVCCGGGGGPTSYSNTLPSYFEIARNDGTGAFDPSFKLPSMGANHIAGVADLDHDGDQDLIAGRVVYYNVHGIEPVMSATVPEYQVFGPLRDLDGDGDPDAAGSATAFLRNAGDGTFETFPRVTPPPPAGTVFLGPGYEGDFDGDGDVDVIVHHDVGGVLNERLLKNNGGGGLLDAGPVTAPGVVFTTDATPDAVWAADVNGDSIPDVIATEQPATGAPKQRVYLQDGSQQFHMAVEKNQRLVRAVTDFDQDGMADTVSLSWTDVVIGFGDPSGSYSVEQTFAGPPGSFLIYPYAATADLDNDGDIDALVPRHIAGATLTKRVRVLENLGGRQFAVHDDAIDYEGAAIPLYAHDVNGDGEVDVLVGQKQDPLTLYGMSVYLGSSARGLDFTYQGDFWPLIWSMADLDGDGDLDGVGSSETYASGIVNTPIESFRRQFGDATPGAGGQEPNFGAVGPFFGGGDIELRITGAAPNAPGILLVGIDDQSAKLAGTGGYVHTLPIIVSLPMVFPSASGEPGSGALTIPVVVPAPAVGFSFFHQVVVIDPQAQGGASVSNALELFYGK